MDEREYPSATGKAPVERSSAEVRQEIATAKENISLPAEEIGERVQEKPDWRGHLMDSPYWALGAAACLGYLGSRLFLKRATPMKRIMGPIAEELRGSGLIKVTLLGIATKAAARWIKNAIS